MRMSQNQRRVMFLNWQNAAGESSSKRFDRNAQDYSAQTVAGQPSSWGLAAMRL